ncbi:putative zingipain [Helianthus annuus]|nr:putative zingipain [Helianthus annuus]KAJ0756676.1 putative zingipain [Helianthus annuus]KAJ0760425.1 putative zingipain [Helianthus annuus]
MICVSCWPFSTIGSVEGINQIVTGDLVTISEQQLLDRDIFYNQGCNGGDIEHAFAFVVNYGGIHTDKDYPCTGKDGKCDTSENETKVVRIDNYEGVPANNEQSLQKAVANQPISVSIEAGSRDFQFYSSGIFNGKCGTDLDHGVVVVGYGAEAGKNYWLLKNSWGGDWGEQGYLRIERNVKETTGKCGIAMKASYPIKNDRSPPNPTAGPSHSTPVTPQPQQFLKEDTQPHLEPNVSGNLIGILSMDGSGVLGIIPSVILAFVEQTLVVISEAIMEIASGYPIASIAVLFPFVLFMVASVATYCTKHMTKTPKLITILSIDGGGVRAIIPCIFLEFLEKKLQELAGENVRLADYFDVMAGTSAGAFVVVMLAAPNKDGRPMLEATDATKFFLRHAPEIFQPPRYLSSKKKLASIVTITICDHFVYTDLICQPFFHNVNALFSHGNFVWELGFKNSFLVCFHPFF